MHIIERKWERTTINFMVGLPKTLTKCDPIWVIVDRLTKSTHFILIRMNYNAAMLIKLYMKEIVRLH